MAVLATVIDFQAVMKNNFLCRMQKDCQLLFIFNKRKLPTNGSILLPKVNDLYFIQVSTKTAKRAYLFQALDLLS